MHLILKEISKLRPVGFTSNITCGCQIEDGEIMPNSRLPIVAAENPPPTQELVSGRIT